MDSVEKSAIDAQGDSGDYDQAPRGRHLQLNSKRLTMTHLHHRDALAAAVRGLELAHIDGNSSKVSELVNSEGAFLHTVPLYGVGKDTGEPERECRELRKQNVDLTEQLADLQQQLKKRQVC